MQTIPLRLVFLTSLIVISVNANRVSLRGRKTEKGVAVQESRLLSQNTTVLSVIAGNQALRFFNRALSATPRVSNFLRTDGPFTIFAPSNDALMAVGTEGLKFQRPEWKAHLRYLLKSHVARGKILISEVTDGGIIKTLTGAPVTASVGKEVSFGGPFFKDSTVVEADLTADNGVVHIIGKVFFPEALKTNLYDMGSLYPNQDFESMGKWIVTAGLEDVLRDKTVTIFGPYYRAFDKLDSAFKTKVDSDPVLAKRIVSNHIVEGVWHKEMFTDGLELTTLANETLTLSVTGGRFPIYKINGAYIDGFDEVGSNGIAHAIDTVLIPKAARP